MLAAGILGGIAWAAIVAWLRVTFNASEILTSLMLNYVAQLLLIYLVSAPWRDPQGFGFPQTAMFSANGTAPILVPETRLHLGVAVAFAVALAGVVRAVGDDPRLPAPRAGRGPARRAFCRLQRQEAHLAVDAGQRRPRGPCRHLRGLGPGRPAHGSDLARLRATPRSSSPFWAGCIRAASSSPGLLLALSYLGGEAAQIDLGLPSAVTGIFQGVLLFFLLACDALIAFRIRWRKPGAAVMARAQIAQPTPSRIKESS